MRKWITSQQLRADQNAVDPSLLKVFATVVDKADGSEDRVARFTITTDDVDRENDVISADGWKTDNFIAAKGPVLWAHDYRQPPVGRTLRLAQAPHGLSADVQFADAETYGFADTVYRLVKGGFLSATSVGFRTLKWEYDEVRGGINFKEQELLEFSIVPVPANPHCLIEARGAGIDVEPLREWAAKTLEHLTEQKAAAPDTTPQIAAPSIDLSGLKRQLDEACNAVSRFTVLVQGLGSSLSAPKKEMPMDPLACPKGTKCGMTASGSCDLPSGECPKKAVPEAESKGAEPVPDVAGDVPKAPVADGDAPNQGDGTGSDTFDIIADEDADIDISVDDIRAAMRDALKETVGTAMNKRLGRVD